MSSAEAEANGVAESDGLQEIPLESPAKIDDPTVPNFKGDAITIPGAEKSEPESTATSTTPSKQTNTAFYTSKIVELKSKPEGQIQYLKDLIKNAAIDDATIVDLVLNMMVGGLFDIETNFIVQEPQCIHHLVKFMDELSEKLQAEIWSMLSGILRKSRRNLLIFTETGFIDVILDSITTKSHMISDLMVDNLTVLAVFSISVTELQHLYSLLSLNDEDEWPSYAPKLLKVLARIPNSASPDNFFSFPGTAGSAISLPPISPSKFQVSDGFSISVWIYLDPLTGVTVDQGKPFLFTLQTREGVGYSAFFAGSVLVLTSNRQPGRGFQASVNYEFEPRKWTHLTLTYIYNRWKTSIIKSYIDGHLISTSDISWPVYPSENLDKCFIGTAPDLHKDHTFCGQMTSFIMFDEALLQYQVDIIYAMGVNYKGQLKFLSTSMGDPARGLKKSLFQCVSLMYTPANCDSLVCLESSSRSREAQIFVHTPHALMTNGVKSVKTNSFENSLHSLGGVQLLFPLLTKLDYEVSQGGEVSDQTLCMTMMDLICTLIERSPAFQQQMIQLKGFQTLASILEQVSSQNMTEHTVKCLIEMTQRFSILPGLAILVRKISDHLLFNPGLWIHTNYQVQFMLYGFISGEYLRHLPLLSDTQWRVSAVVQMLHSIKFYYWITNPAAASKIQPCGTERGRPTTEELQTLRAQQLMFIDRVLTVSNVVLDDELQCFLNYLHTVREVDNVTDVLGLLSKLLSTLPHAMVPLFDEHNGICALFALLDIDNEHVIVQSLNLLANFLRRSTLRRKIESMDRHNLYNFIGVKLTNRSRNILSWSIYHELFSILIDQNLNGVDIRRELDLENKFIQNPGMLRVLGTVLNQCEQNEQLRKTKHKFLADLTSLCEDSEINRRTVLQMSVWQSWLLSLLEKPQDRSEFAVKIYELIMHLLNILLYHAIKLEYGGWRVWIDTLSILHSKVVKDGAAPNSAAPGMAAGTTRSLPDFHWSGLHNALFSSILQYMEDDILPLRDVDGDRYDEVMNEKSLQLNVINLISSISDVLITAVGGLLSLLSAATTSSGEIDVLEPSFGMSIEDAVAFLHRIMQLVDIILSNSTVALGDIESEKNMSAGTILRQCLRMACMSAVRTYLECRYKEGSIQDSQRLSDRNGGTRTSNAVLSLITGMDQLRQSNASAPDRMQEPIGDLLHLLQNVDIQRLQLVLHREIDDTKQAEWIAMAIIYFISVMMVSKYRDVIEPETDTPAHRNSQSLSSMPEVNSESQEKSSQSSVETPNQTIADGERPTIDETEDPVPQPEVSQPEVLTTADVVVHAEDDPKDTDVLASPVKSATETPETADPVTSSADQSETNEASTEQSNEETSDQSAATEESTDQSAATQESTDQSAATEESTDRSEAHESKPDEPDEVFPGTSESSAIDQSEETPDQVATPDPEPVATTEPVTTVEQSDGNETVDEEAKQKVVAEAKPETSDDTEDKPVTPKADPEPEPSQGQTSASQPEKSDPPIEDGREEGDGQADNEEEADVPTLSTIHSSQSPPPKTEEAARPTQEQVKKELPKSVKMAVDQRAVSMALTDKLEKVLSTSSPLLRNIFIEFAPYLTKTLLGSKGQELLQGGLTAIRSGKTSTELVMLLCSQEWQVSLQKHAGLAFIELVNEGRQLSRTTRDHMTKVATEANHIENKMRAEDANKHNEFITECDGLEQDATAEESLCHRLIMSARRRDLRQSNELVAQVSNMVNSSLKPREEPDAESYWKLDNWEDDSRRHRRLIHNAHGSRHSEASLRVSKQTEDDFQQALAISDGVPAAKRSAEPLQDDSALFDVGDELSGQVRMSVECITINLGVEIHGILSLTQQQLTFAWDEESPDNKKNITPEMMKFVDVNARWNIREIRAIFNRTYLLERRALEIFLINRTSIFLVLPSWDELKRLVSLLPPVGIGIKYGLKPSRKFSLLTPSQLFSQSNMTERWHRREVSNFDYIMFLNTISGRTYNDLNQYPVFPWVLSNYTSETIDLSEPSNYRDLSKPIGALNGQRAALFQERYNTWDIDNIPPFHYGTHYSTSAFTLNWLIRMEPYTTIFLRLQEGQFDHPDRTFSSLERAWSNCQSDTSDVKELIPELFYLPEMLVNSNSYEFGSRSDGFQVGDVVLPPWAKSPHEFIRIHREALESEIVSCRLHEWVDLVFGYKQQGREAQSSLNVFHYLTYEGGIDKKICKDPVIKAAVENQIRSFGQTPSQLLTNAHPIRGSQLSANPKVFKEQPTELCMTLDFWSGSPVVFMSQNAVMIGGNLSVLTVLQNKLFFINPWDTEPKSVPGAEEGSTRMAVLPLSADLGVQTNPPPNRNLANGFDERIKVTRNNFALTLDNSHLFVSGFWDGSFRVYNSITGLATQVLFGHFGTVTCLCRSEVNLSHDCFIVTGSTDCTCMLWQWSGQDKIVMSNSFVSPSCPAPLVTFTGHTSTITTVSISAELGVIASGSQGSDCLIHTMNGDLLRVLKPDVNLVTPTTLIINREGYITVVYDNSQAVLYSLNGEFLNRLEHQDGCRAITMTRDGRFVITAGDSGVVSIRRAYNLEEVFSYEKAKSSVYDLLISTCQRFIMAGLGNGAIAVLNVDFTKWHHDYQRITKG